MLANIIDGRQFATQLELQLAAEVNQLTQAGYPAPALAVVLVGNNPASSVYVKNKQLACQRTGIKSILFELDENIEEEKLLHLIAQLNDDDHVHGILVQLPLPAHLHADKIIDEINFRKDVDGFHMTSLKHADHALFTSCTPQGVMQILKHFSIPLQNAHAVIIGESRIVGKPMAIELKKAGCKITVCNRETLNLSETVKQADILVSAAGVAHLIQGDWIKPGATIIDVGTNYLADGTMVGDVDFEAAKEKAGFITPVPGGVGPVTVAALLQNTLRAAKNFFELV